MKIIVTFLLFLFLGQSYCYLKVNQLNENVECPPWDEDGEISFIPDPDDCAKYYVCTPSGPEPQYCSGGLWFDDTLDVCNWPELVDCAGRP